MTASDFPIEAKQGKQKEWDNLVAKKIAKELLDNARGPLDQARLRAAVAPHSGDWLLAPPITAVGLRMTNETIRIALEWDSASIYPTLIWVPVGSKWEVGDPRSLMSPQCCVDQSAQHGQRHHLESNAEGKNSSSKGTTRSTTKWQQASRRSNAYTVEARQISCMGCHHAWHICAITSADNSHERRTCSRQVSRAADKSAVSKTQKYQSILQTHLFTPTAIETAGVRNSQAREFITEPGNVSPLSPGN